MRRDCVRVEVSLEGNSGSAVLVRAGEEIDHHLPGPGDLTKAGGGAAEPWIREGQVQKLERTHQRPIGQALVSVPPPNRAAHFAPDIAKLLGERQFMVRPGKAGQEGGKRCGSDPKSCLTSSGCESRPAQAEPGRPVASLVLRTATRAAMRGHASKRAA